MEGWESGRVRNHNNFMFFFFSDKCENVFASHSILYRPWVSSICSVHTMTGDIQWWWVAVTPWLFPTCHLSAVVSWITSWCPLYTSLARNNPGYIGCPGTISKKEFRDLGGRLRWWNSCLRSARAHVEGRGEAKTGELSGSLASLPSELQVNERPCLIKQSRWHLKLFPGFHMHVHMCAHADMTTYTHTQACRAHRMHCSSSCLQMSSQTLLFYLMASKPKHGDVMTLSWCVIIAHVYCWWLFLLGLTNSLWFIIIVYV